jgi:hypothetical protein
VNPLWKYPKNLLPSPPAPSSSSSSRTTRSSASTKESENGGKANAVSQGNDKGKEQDQFLPPPSKKSATPTLSVNSSLPSSSSSTSFDSFTSYNDPTKIPIGRDSFRQAIIQRLIPALRAFNPNLILLSTGFDAADGDVGNYRHSFGNLPVKGMDLKQEDFAWATTGIHLSILFS